MKTSKQLGELVMPLVKVKHKFQVTIPTEIREKTQIAEGDVLEMTVQGDKIILKPKLIIDRDSIPAALAEGIKDYQEGRTCGPFVSVQEFKEALKKV
jgi:AbrB family looped-hinge helix DNA binding protein